MSDLISRQAALDIIDAGLNGWLTDDERLHLEGVAIGIECLPTIDPVKHGKWIGVSPMVDTEECSLCGFQIQSSELATPYCPWCGAQLEVSDETN